MADSLDSLLKGIKVKSKKLSTKCPKCKRGVSSIIIGGGDFYHLLWHKTKRCTFEWTYSTYEQCKMLQEAREEMLIIIAKENHLDGGKDGMSERTVSKIIGGSIGIKGATIALTATGGIIWVGIGAAVFWGLSRFHKKEGLKYATQASYDLSENFPNLKFPNHVLNRKFIDEAIAHIPKYFFKNSKLTKRLYQIK